MATGIGPRAGTAAEKFLFNNLDVMPSLHQGAPDGVMMGPFVPDNTNRNKDVSVGPAGRIGGWLTANGQTYDLKTFDYSKVKIPHRQLVRIRKETGQKLSSSLRSAIVPRFGVKLPGDSDWRKITIDFNRWESSAGPTELDVEDFGTAGDVLCGRPAPVLTPDGVLHMFFLYYTGASNNIGHAVYDPLTFSWWASATGITNVSPVTASAHADLGGCFWNGSIYLAVINSSGSMGSALCKVKVLTFNYKDSTSQVQATLSIGAAFGSNVLNHESNKPLGIDLIPDKRGRSMVMVMSCLTRGKYSDASTNVLTVLHSRTTDGVNWGQHGTADANAIVFSNLPGFEPISDINTPSHTTIKPPIAATTYAAPDNPSAGYQVGYAAGLDGKGYKTYDGGRNWVEMSGLSKEGIAKIAGSTPIQWQGCHCTKDGVNILFVGTYGTIARSTDRGDTWKLIRSSQPDLKRAGTFDAAVTGEKSLAFSATLYDCVFARDNSAQYYFVIGGNGQVLYTDDHGATMVSKRSGIGSLVTYRACALRDSQTGLVVVGSPDANNSNKRIIHTSDATATPPTWTVTDVSDPDGRVLLGLTRKVGGSVHGYYGYSSGRGMIVGELGTMIAFDSSTSPTELLDADSNRWTGADLHDAAWIDVNTRYVAGDGGVVLRTIDYPTSAAPSAGTPSFAQEVVPSPQAIRGVFAYSVTEAVVGGSDGWALKRASTANRTFARGIYTDGGEYLIAVANPGQREIELFFSTDDGVSFQQRPPADAKRKITFAHSGAVNEVDADDGSLGTPSPSFCYAIDRTLLLTVGNAPSGTAGNEWGMASVDDGNEWMGRLDQSLAIPLGAINLPDAAPGSAFWAFNATRTTIAYGGGRIFTFAYDENRRYIGTWVARDWSDTIGRMYCPVVPGVAQYIGDSDLLSDPHCIFSGLPAIGDRFVSEPDFEYGDRNLIRDSPSKFRRSSDHGLLGTTDQIIQWDREDADIIAIKGEGDRFIFEGCYFPTNAKTAYFDHSIPSYDASTWGTTAQYVRHTLSSVVATLAVSAETGTNILTITGTTLRRNQFAPKNGRTYWINGFRIVSNGPDWIEIRRASASPSLVGSVEVFDGRLVKLGGEVKLANNTVVAADWAASTYRAARLARLVLPDSGVYGEDEDGNAEPLVRNACAGQIVTPTQLFGHGFSVELIANTLEETTAANTSHVEHFGNIGKQFAILYPAPLANDSDELLNSLARDEKMRRPVFMATDSNDPANQGFWVRLGAGPKLGQVVGDRFALPLGFNEVM